MSFVRMDKVGSFDQLDYPCKNVICETLYGIESLNPAVTKSIRKGGGFNVITELVDCESRIEAFNYGNFVIDLQASEEDMETCKNYSPRAVANKCWLPTSYSDLQNDEIKSDIDKDLQSLAIHYR